MDVRILASSDPDDDSFIIEEGIYGDNYATISSDRTTISGLEANFSNKDQRFGYRFFIYNASEYDAYLKSVDFLNYLGVDTNKVCTAMEGTNQAMVDAACEDIHFGLNIEGELVIDKSRNNFTTVKISKGDYIWVDIGIGYAGEELNEFYGLEGGNSLLPNGDFKVNFGDIKMNFSSLEG